MTLFIAGCGLLGLLVGSFLNVVIWRVPRGESIVRPRSHCPGCGAEIASKDNVPVVSWLALRGRCRHCSAPISVRYPAVELLTGSLFALLAWRFGAVASLAAFLYLAAVGVALAAIDLDVRRLPDAITKPSYVVAAALLVTAALADSTPHRLATAAAGAAILGAVYAALWIAYPKGMGRGDVKLSVLLGTYLGFLGWGALAVGAFLGFLYGGLVGIALMAMGKAGRKSKIPYGPFMVAGALTAVFLAHPIVHAYLGMSRG